MSSPENKNGFGLSPRSIAVYAGVFAVAFGSTIGLRQCANNESERAQPDRPDVPLTVTVPVPKSPGTSGPEELLADRCFRQVQKQLKEIDDRRVDGEPFKAKVRVPEHDDPDVLFDGVQAVDTDPNIPGGVWNPIVLTCNEDGKTKDAAYVGVFPGMPNSNVVGGVTLDEKFTKLQGVSKAQEIELHFPREGGSGFEGSDGKIYGIIEGDIPQVVPNDSEVPTPEQA